MSRSLIVVLALTVLTVCATSSNKATSGGSSGPTEKSQKISNIAHFDVGTCFAKPPALPPQITKEVVLALQVAARPLVMECLVNPASRGPEQTTKVNLETRYEGGAFNHHATGDNLTADGEKCIVDSLTRYTSGATAGAIAPEPEPEATPPAKSGKKGAAKPEPKPAEAKPAANAAPVANTFEYQHDREQDPTVTYGLNEISDMVGAARLAMPTWCDCYESAKDSVPPSFVAKLDVVKGSADAGPSTQVTLDAPADGGAAVDPGAVGQCLEAKLKAFPFQPQSQENKFPFIFIHVNSQATGNPDLPDLNVKLTQLELQRQRRQAERVISFALLNDAATRYQQLVEKYKANSMSVTRSQLIGRCTAMAKADESYVAILKAIKDVSDVQVSTVKALRAADQSYPESVEKGTLSLAETSAKELAEAEATLTNDKAICAKLSK